MARSDEETIVDTRRGTIARADNAPGARDRACLIVIRGLNVGEMYKLAGKPEMVLGRGQQVDVEILDDGISRRHAALRFRDDQVLLEDLGSRNGTFVNGQRVEGSRPIQDGDKIQLSSSTILKFTYADRLDESFQRRMYESSLRDGLTKSFNRKYFLDRLEREFRFAKRHRQPLALIMLDIDEFKKLNDSRGHLAGDRVLADLAAEIHAAIRSEDVFARYGGEEFAVVCRATDVAGAAVFGERLRAAIEARSFEHEDQPMSVTVSVGIAGLSAEHTDSMALLAAADDALYAAKRAGRNRVHVQGTPG
jgi:diguanylate cyclase (GGDEF)-like protein